MITLTPLPIQRSRPGRSNVAGHRNQLYAAMAALIDADTLDPTDLFLVPRVNMQYVEEINIQVVTAITVYRVDQNPDQIHVTWIQFGELVLDGYRLEDTQGEPLLDNDVVATRLPDGETITVVQAFTD